MQTTYTLPAAAKLAGCSTTTIRRWISNGAVIGRKNEGGDWRIDSDSFLAYIATAQPATAATRSLRGATAQPEANNIVPYEEHTSLVIMELRDALNRERENVASERRLNSELRSENKTLRDDLFGLMREFREIAQELRQSNSTEERPMHKVSRWFGKLVP